LFRNSRVSSGNNQLIWFANTTFTFFWPIWFDLQILLLLVLHDLQVSQTIYFETTNINRSTITRTNKDVSRVSPKQVFLFWLHTQQLYSFNKMSQFSIKTSYAWWDKWFNGRDSMSHAHFSSNQIRFRY